MVLLWKSDYDFKCFPFLTYEHTDMGLKMIALFIMKTRSSTIQKLNRHVWVTLESFHGSPNLHEVDHTYILSLFHGINNMRWDMARILGHIPGLKEEGNHRLGLAPFKIVCIRHKEHALLVSQIIVYKTSNPVIVNSFLCPALPVTCG